MKSEYKSIAREWLAKAESDLAYARASFSEFDDFFSQMCILCHDAAEKFLKAVIVSKGGKPESIHDLVTLLGSCTTGDTETATLPDLEEPCRLLNRYYIPLKYPSHYPAMSRMQAQQAIEAAEIIRMVVLSRLMPHLET